MTSTDSGLGAEEARGQLYKAMRQDAEFQEKAARALELGQQYFGVENAHLTRIDSTAGYWKALESTDPPGGLFSAGLILDLGTTYCRRTIREDSPIALHDAPNQGWADDPAFETHNLHCYLGVPIEVDDEVYGTACFVSKAPRDEPFTQEELMYAELIGHLLGHAIDRKRYEAELTERTEMVDVLSRVLRHNLRNDMTVIQGHAEIVQDQVPVDAGKSVEAIITTIEDLTELSDKARQLSDLVAKSSDRQELDVASSVERIVTEVEETYPDTSVSVEGRTDIQIQASRQLETALRELLENAAKHAGDNPSVTICLSSTQQSLQIRVSDGGRGMNDQEQAVLQLGDETPLKHGSGLGLWLVYWIVTRHNGSIETAVSESGTTVTISLPYGPVKGFR